MDNDLKYLANRVVTKKKTVFREGPIAPTFIAEAIEKHQVKTHIGAHDIFLGQVRADVIEGNSVSAIDYSAYVPMAEEVFTMIREETFARYSLSCMHIYHSLGKVAAGEICLFVFVSAPHRKVCFEAIEWLVNQIKERVPIFGKEIFQDESHQWKVNQ